MKLGVFTLLLGHKPIEEVLDYLKSLGAESVEFGVGGYVKAAHTAGEELLADNSKLQRIKKQVADRNLMVSAISVHGNPLHPNPQISQTHHDDFVRACEIAAKLEVPNVITLSGCPGSDPKAELPSWVVSPLPPEDFYRSWEWQWKEKVIPYWREASATARRFGVRVAIEMVPNMVVYNVETMLKLREAIGETIGANLDPSHLFWQGSDIGAVIRALGDSIYHFHAKDSAVNPYVAAVNGILDAKPLTDEPHRSWLFRTVGTGHGQLEWANIFAQLRLAGYDGAVSIEHEDSLMSADEGLRKAIRFLQHVLIFEKAGVAYWAQ
jgi:sugar phosphate isomerase/epimerase